MNEFIEQFIIECREHVEQATSVLQILDSSPSDSEAIDALFRAMHTLKGSAGIIDFVPMERVLHEAETALSEIRTGKGQVSTALNAGCIACLDVVVRWLDEMDRTGDLPRVSETQVNALLERLSASPGSDATQNVSARENASVESSSEFSTPFDSLLPPNARLIIEAQVALLDEVQAAFSAGHVAAAGNVVANVLRTIRQEDLAERMLRVTEQSLRDRSVRNLREQIAEILGNAAKSPIPSIDTRARPDNTTRTLRVDAGQIEQLVRLIGELTVVKNTIGHLADVALTRQNSLAGEWKNQHAVLDRITGEAQRLALGMRVLPLRTVFARFPAIMREMSAHLGKPAKLIIEGDETEADKTIVEMLFEPLLHVFRNAMDHGIEASSVRAGTHKPAMATVVMRAARRGDRVIIEVEDDGKGVDVARVGEVAVQRGVVTSERLAEMQEPEIIDLIFAAGFSTATKVTEISGRGVGMDAVRTAVGRIGGSVAVESHAGRGATFQFSLPFSVMMTQVMTVEAGGQTFGIPLEAVIETIRLPTHDLAGVGAAQAIVHRERTLPVFELANLLQVQSARTDDAEAVIVVTSFNGHWGGIRIDKVGSRMEVMLKPLDGLLAGIPGITGTTIMGDGRVLLVLDLTEILS